MSAEDLPKTVDIDGWVERARNNPPAYLERQVIETLLAAIAITDPWGEKLYLKGGILMGLVYRSPRQTVDVDFTADFEPIMDDVEELRRHLNQNLRRTSARIGYPSLACRIQRIEPKPRKDNFENATAPALQVKLAYAELDTGAYRKLEMGRCPQTLKIDINFREPVHSTEAVRLDGAAVSVPVYSRVDIIAEKLRALLQQVRRGHPRRRQDVYDIAYLIQNCPPDDSEKKEILHAFLEKSKVRGIKPDAESIADPEVEKRAKEEWDSLRLELADLPLFEDAYGSVKKFYRSLPWEE